MTKKLKTGDAVSWKSHGGEARWPSLDTRRAQPDQLLRRRQQPCVIWAKPRHRGIEFKTD